MPRKTKESEENQTNTKTTLEKKSRTKNKINITEKKEKATTKKSSTRATSKSTTAKTAKKSSTSKVTKTKKSPNKSTTKKTATKKTASKKVATKKTNIKDYSKEPNILEYYDLPYRYNQTVVKLLAQTPNTLFIYWDISDSDRENYKKIYGDNFFETTKPVLIIHNDTMNYSFEVEINDFANSWYLHVNDSNCNYRIELGRRVINNISNHASNLNINDYVYISSSNKIESPNDRVLFDKNQKMVYFRNIKTNQETKKDISTFTFMRNMGKIYNIYDLYKEFYKNENIDEISNPSSNYKGDK